MLVSRQFDWIQSEFFYLPKIYQESRTCRVPQGSILGPLLFTICVNDLPMVIDRGRNYLYADDTAIAVSDHPSDIEQKLNSSLSTLATWFAKYKLESKTYAKIKLLGRVCHILGQDPALTLYKTLILPIYDYCDYVYYSVNQTDKEFLQKLQNCAFRTILRVEWLTSTAYTHETLCMDTLDN